MPVTYKKNPKGKFLIDVKKKPLAAKVAKLTTKVNQAMGPVRFTNIDVNMGFTAQGLTGWNTTGMLINDPAIMSLGSSFENITGLHYRSKKIRIRGIVFCQDDYQYCCRVIIVRDKQAAGNTPLVPYTTTASYDDVLFHTDQATSVPNVMSEYQFSKPRRFTVLADRMISLGSQENGAGTVIGGWRSIVPLKIDIDLKGRSDTSVPNQTTGVHNLSSEYRMFLISTASNTQAPSFIGTANFYYTSD